ncbi:hypothetical protein [Psychrobacter vallis]|uniref:hypothetical protein n=1 Tax=Psychrobacter vallis TaxID=248451 RepID=UPI0019194724|nr:hypothetical protein [Psychrobacter vallis]
MKIIFENERFENNYFINKALYRLEAIENISKHEPFEFLRVKFFKLHETVSIDKLKSHESTGNYNKYFDSIGAKFSARLISVDIRVEYLYLMSAGSIWKAKGSKSIEKVFEPITSETIEIGIERNRCVQEDVYKSLNTSAKFNPLNLNNKLPLLAISDSFVESKNTTVLIPYSEIVRHYFSASKYFISKLFEEDRIVELAELIGSVEDNSDICSVKLNSRHFLDSDVPFIARALLDKTTLFAMRSIHSRANNALNHSEQKGYYHRLTGLPLETTLPFKDKTKLDVIGHYLNIEGSEDRFFLVRKIQTCHHSWPFKKLNIISAETFKDREREEYEVRVSKEQATVEEDQIELTAGDRPSANKTELVIELDQSARFPFLNTLPVQKKHEQDGKEETVYNVIGISQVTLQDNEAVNKGSLGQENYIRNNPINPVQITPERGPSEIKSLNEISEIFHEIESANENWRVTALPLNHTDNTHPYGLFDFEGTKWSEVYERNRKGLLLRVEIRDRAVLYCLDIEPYKSATFSLFLFTSPIQGTNEMNLAGIINTISESRGKGIKSILESRFKMVEPLKHISYVNNPIENRIVNKINEII